MYTNNSAPLGSGTFNYTDDPLAPKPASPEMVDVKYVTQYDVIPMRKGDVELLRGFANSKANINRVVLIKWLRSNYGTDLKTAKDIVDTLYPQNDLVEVFKDAVTLAAMEANDGAQS